MRRKPAHFARVKTIVAETFQISLFSLLERVHPGILRTYEDVEFDDAPGAENHVDPSMATELHTAQEIASLNIVVTRADKKVSFIDKYDEIACIPRDTEDIIDVGENVFAFIIPAKDDSIVFIVDELFDFLSIPCDRTLVFMVQVEDQKLFPFFPRHSSCEFPRESRLARTHLAEYQYQFALLLHFLASSSVRV